MGAMLSESLSVVAPRLPVRIVSAAALDRVRAVASRLPAPLSNWFYLERALGGGATDSPVDLIVNVDAHGGELLAGHNRAIAIDDQLRRHPVWSRVENFAREWRDADSALARDLSELWLEFDVDTNASPNDVPAPSVFVDFSPDVYHGSPSRRIDAALGAVNALACPSLSAETTTAMRDCIGRLPENGLLLYAGCMLARPDNGVRLCIMGLDSQELASYVAAIGWPGSHDTLRRLTSELASLDNGAHAQPAIVHIDIAPALRPRIGLEYTFARESQLAGAIAEAELLEFLVARGLATGGERDALALWPGAAVTTMPHELWPSIVVRRVNHVKLVIEADGQLAAKIYLCAGHEYSARRTKPTQR